MPLALVFLFVLLLLEFGLIHLQDQARTAALEESSRAAQLIGTEEVYANLATTIETGNDTGPVKMGKKFEYDVPVSPLTLTAEWSNSSSLNNPLARDFATYNNLFEKEGGELPVMAFLAKNSKDAHGGRVPPGHTALTLKSSHKDLGTSLASYSHLFPYGVFAPKGKISAGSVQAFANPVFAEKGVQDPSNTGRPVDIFAGSDIEVTDNYDSGRAISRSGSVKLPSHENNGAIPMSGFSMGADSWTSLFADLVEKAKTVSGGAMDKTHYFGDALFSKDTFSKLFKGDVSSLLNIFSVGQACKVPFFPIPAMQDDAPLLIVFYVLVPYPPDFSGTAKGDEASKRQAELTKEMQAKQKEIDAKKKELDDELAKDKKDRDEDKISDLRGEIASLQDDYDALKKEATDIAKKKDDEKDDISKSIFDAEVPDTAAQDAEFSSTGWSYSWLLNDIWKFVKAIISGDDPFEAVIEESRVVHLGDNNPDWKWESDKTTVKANLSVPVGRTLKLSTNIDVEGDVYLSKGAVLHIAGNLTVSRPSGWTDFKGADTSVDNSVAYPKGRIILEEGSTLVVDGDLEAEGTYNEGSILLASKYGPAKGQTNLVYAKGDIKLKYGMMPGVDLGDLIDKLAEDNSSLVGFNDQFFTPYTERVIPQAAKFPYVGPWQWRSCWFAKYATTFEFLPWLEEFGLGGPWPIPLPFENCLRKVFKYVSRVYSVELNFFTGENLYTHSSSLWLFGRGVSPVLLKIPPDIVKENLGNIQWAKISLDAIETEMEHFLVDSLPDFAVNVFKDIIYNVMIQAVESLIPFKPPSCGSKGSDDEDDESGVEGQIKEKIEELVKDAIKEFSGILDRTFKRMLLNLKNNFYNEMNDGDDEKSILKELPGLVLFSEKKIEVGTGSTARLGMGLLVAKGDIVVKTNKMVGVLVSLEGDVEVENLYHYPYFDRVSAYSPKKYGSLTESLVDFTDAQGSLVGDVGKLFPRRLAEGWSK